MIDQRLASRTWAAGRGFSMADCAAAPALFFAICGPDSAAIPLIVLKESTPAA